MSGQRPFEELAAPITADPERRARVERIEREMDIAINLGKLREQMQRTQTDVANALSTTQVNVSRIEHREDLHLSTINKYVEALGGRLEIRAVFPEGTVDLIESKRDCDNE